VQDLSGFTVFVAEPMDCFEHTYECMAERGAKLIVGPPVSQADKKYTEAELIELGKEADAIIVMTRDPVTPAVLDGCPKVRIISKYGRGIDHLPLDAAAERGILITNTPISHNATVAETTFTIMMTCMRRTHVSAAHLLRGGWRDPAIGGNELRYKTVGIVGFGGIGKAMIKRLAGWEVTEILVADPFAERAEVEAMGCHLVDLPELCRRANVISLHVPLFPETRHMIGKEQFAMMPKGAYIVNTSRGALIDEAEMIKALESGHLGGAALDCFEQEPVSLDNPLLKMKNVVATPHNAGLSDESTLRICSQASKSCIEALLGQVPEFVCNPAGIGKFKERFCK